ncbi:alpha carbonic anhydrase 7 [Quercus suber]|uniref:Alpha carbonic anhydrase 7 n=1 Tax=Quercus suber TaxID=58331 RepID=A0AAW0KHE1_QUESU
MQLKWASGVAGSIEIIDIVYYLQQCHWHSPSEHSINGINKRETWARLIRQKFRRAATLVLVTHMRAHLLFLHVVEVSFGSLIKGPFTHLLLLVYIISSLLGANAHYSLSW